MSVAPVRSNHTERRALLRRMVEVGRRADLAVISLLEAEREYAALLDEAREATGMGTTAMRLISAGEFVGLAASSLRELSPSWSKVVSREPGATKVAIEVEMRSGGLFRDSKGGD